MHKFQYVPELEVLRNFKNQEAKEEWEGRVEQGGTQKVQGRVLALLQALLNQVCAALG